MYYKYRLYVRKLTCTTLEELPNHEMDRCEISEWEVVSAALDITPSPNSGALVYKLQVLQIKQTHTVSCMTPATVKKWKTLNKTTDLKEVFKVLFRKSKYNNLTSID